MKYDEKVEIAQTVATQPRQLQYSNNLSKKKKKKQQFAWELVALRRGGFLFFAGAKLIVFLCVPLS